MRTVHEPQMKFDEVDIATIELDLKSRDDIPPILAVCNTYTPMQHYAPPYSRFWNELSPREAVRA